MSNDHRTNRSRHAALRYSAVILFAVALAVQAGCTASAPTPKPRTFGTPEDAVKALADVVKAGKLEELLAIFGPGSDALVDSSDAATGRVNREIFAAAFAEGWELLEEAPGRKTLVIGNEGWPFPVPLVKDSDGWRFDVAAGTEEILARRIGRNELAVIQICRTYVTAQHRYAEQGHDGKPAGLYAKTFGSDPGKHNGLYWPDVRGEKRSPLGDLAARAEEEGRRMGPDGQQQPVPFHGYYFKILTAQGPAAEGGARSYIVNGDMSGGFALVASPAQYDASGVMTFVINQDGVLRQKDLGPGTDAIARAMTLYEPDASWSQP